MSKDIKNWRNSSLFRFSTTLVLWVVSKWWPDYDRLPSTFYLANGIPWNAKDHLYLLINPSFNFTTCIRKRMGKMLVPISLASLRQRCGCIFGTIYRRWIFRSGLINLLCGCENRVAPDLCDLFTIEVLKLLFLWGCVFTGAFNKHILSGVCL